MYLRTVLRSLPVRSAIAEIVKPSRCNSRILIASPRLTTDPPAASDTATMIGHCVNPLRVPRANAQTGEISNDTFGEITSGNDTGQCSAPGGRAFLAAG